MTATEAAIIDALRKSPGLTTWELIQLTGLEYRIVSDAVQCLYRDTGVIRWADGRGWVLRGARD